MKKDTTNKTPDEPLTIEGGAAVEGKETPGETSAPERHKKADGPVMYIGPNALREGLQRYQVYKEIPTERMESLKAAFPHIEHLFVKIDRLGAALDEVTKKGTLRSVAYNEVLEVEA